MVKFAGQRVGDGTPPVVGYGEGPQVAVAEPQHVNLAEFIDKKAKPSGKLKASLTRKVDLADSRIGYVERRTKR